MNPRVEYQMSEEDYNKIINACRPVPMIMLHVGTPRSVQENANDAWAALGEKMGFDYMTARPSEKGKLFFTAVPSETEPQRKARIIREEYEKKEKRRIELKKQIKQLTAELNELKPHKQG